MDASPAHEEKGGRGGAGSSSDATEVKLMSTFEENELGYKIMSDAE